MPGRNEQGGNERGMSRTSAFGRRPEPNILRGGKLHESVVRLTRTLRTARAAGSQIKRDFDFGPRTRAANDPLEE